MHRPARWQVVAPLLAASIILLPGCSDDDDPTGPDGTTDVALDLTVTLDAEAVSEFGGSGHVFASTTDGALLATAAWDGAGPVSLANDDSTHAEVLVTVVSQDGTELRTLRPVPPAGAMTILDNDYPESEGTAQVEIANPPAHTAYIVATNGTMGISQSELPRSLIVGVTGPVTDLYLRLDDADGPMAACWVRGLHQDDLTSVDLAAAGVLQPVIAHSLTVPAMPDNGTLSWRVARRYEEGSWPEIISLEIDQPLASGPVVEAHLPVAMWESDELLTQIAVLVPAPEPSYTYVLHGPWPSELPTVDRDVTLISLSPDGFAWDWVDARHRAFCSWINPEVNTPVRWDVDGWGGADAVMVLPELPAVVTEGVDFLDHDAFVPSALMLERDVSDTFTLRVAMVIPAE